MLTNFPCTTNTFLGALSPRKLFSFSSESAFSLISSSPEPAGTVILLLTLPLTCMIIILLFRAICHCKTAICDLLKVHDQHCPISSEMCGAKGIKKHNISSASFIANRNTLSLYVHQQEQDKYC
jgi:hypothetical protein